MVGWFGSQAFRGELGGELGGPAGIAVNETGAGGVEPGTTYVADGRNARISVHKGTGHFKEAWGYDVTGVNEIQTITIQAEGGSYKLSYGGQTTAALPFNTESPAILSALTALPTIGVGNVAVSGFQSNEAGIIGTVTFQNGLGGIDAEDLITNGSGLTGSNKSGGPAFIKAETTRAGGGGNVVAYEQCTVAAFCSAGTIPVPNPAVLGVIQNNISQMRVAVDQQDGSVYVGDNTLRRIHKFSATGTPLFVWGRDVNQSQAGTNFEICPRPANPTDICKTGSTAAGNQGGWFGSAIGGVAVVPQGLPNAQNVVVTDSANRRFQEFTNEGAFVRAFGWDIMPKASPKNIPGNEVQSITVPATGGAFEVSYNGQSAGGMAVGNVTGGSPTVTSLATAIGEGNVSNGSTNLSSFQTFQGKWLVGQTITGFGIQPGTTITVAAANPTTLTLSKPATASGSDKIYTAEGPQPLAVGQTIEGTGIPAGTKILSLATGTLTMTANATATASDVSLFSGIPYNAPAGEVQSAINALPTISTGGGAVTVAGGPGDATGSTPYEVTFSAGSVGDIDVVPMTTGGRGLGTAVGSVLGCTSPAATTTTYQWLRNGAPIAGATSQTYTTQVADAGAAIQCQVYASSENTSVGAAMAQATVPPVMVSPLAGGRPPMPKYRTLPFLTATFLPGQTNSPGGDGGYVLHCNPGVWLNNPTSFKYQWYRSGVPLTGAGGPTTANYTVQPKDIATQTWFQCGVTATNADGAVTQMTSKNSGFPPEEVGSPSDSPVATSTSTQIVDPTTVGTIKQGGNFEVCPAANATECGLGVAGTGIGQFNTNNPGRVAVDSSGAIVSHDQFKVTKLTPSGETFTPSVFGTENELPAGAPNSTVNNFNILAIAFGENENLLALKQYGAGVTTECFGGLPSTSERRVQELSPGALTMLDVMGECTRFQGASALTGLGSNRLTGDIYHANEHNTNFGQEGERVFIFNEPTPPDVQVDTLVPTGTTAAITGTVDPNPTPSTYLNPPPARWQVEYKKSSDSAWKRFRTPISVGSGSGDVPFKITLTPLLANTDYDMRVAVVKDFESIKVLSPVEAFKTKTAPPAILSTQSTHVLEHSAILQAQVDPRGSETDYYFEWGPTTAYGNVTPISSVGSGQGAALAETKITGLESRTYHFRVIAENSAGKDVGDNQTINFHPPTCPNSLVRQQTGAAYLPDCRAYELVSPPNAGNTVINSFTGPNSAYATSPSRLSYIAMFAPLPVGGNPPNNQDLYISTRTTTGWASKQIGKPAHERYLFGGHPGPTGFAGFWFTGSRISPEMDRIMLWDLGYLEATPPSFVSAPYIFNAEGQVLEQWPTNVEEIPGGQNFIAQSSEMMSSPDLRHFYFSSSVPFIPGAPATAIYHNDTVAGTLEIVSKDPNGLDFSGYPIESSFDGSRLLMSNAKPPFCSTLPCALPQHEMYMRDGSETLDVTQGHKASYSGMTKDASKVYFLSDEKVSPGETDTSTDLYMWDADSEEITRVSSGIEGTGDTNECIPIEGWTKGCSVEPVFRYQQECGGYTGVHDNCGPQTPKPRFTNGYFNYQTAARGGHPMDDMFLAAEDGDIYFYSPEKLAGDAFGAEGMPNLYVLHDGDLQFVATLDPPNVCRGETQFGSTGNYCAEGPIGRFQVTPNGEFAAFSAKTQLTAYDNKGFEEIYRYRPETETITCVSCLQNGMPPTSNVDASQNGRFITDDGRTFFSTNDALQANDTNKAQDVYEYVDGKPQLITQGTGSTTAALCPSCGLGQFAGAGLISVSADGTDVYFGTYDVLVPQDLNGGNLKIYDARTAGGFAVPSVPADCEAADECHGPSSTDPSPVVGGTETNLGNQGNVVPASKKSKLKKKAKKRAKKKKARAKKKKSSKRNASRSDG